MNDSREEDWTVNLMVFGMESGEEAAWVKDVVLNALMQEGGLSSYTFYIGYQKDDT